MIPLMPGERRREYRPRRSIGNDGTSEILPILLLNRRHIDDSGLQIGRLGIERRCVFAGVDAVNLLLELLIETSQRMLAVSLASLAWPFLLRRRCLAGRRSAVRRRAILRMRQDFDARKIGRLRQ